MNRFKKAAPTILLFLCIFSCSTKTNPPRIPSGESTQTPSSSYSERVIPLQSISPDSTAWGEKRWVQSRTNIRSGRSTDSRIVGRLNSGDPVRVDFLLGKWYAVFNMTQSVRAESLAIGYVYAPLLMPSLQEAAKLGVEAIKEREKAKQLPTDIVPAELPKRTPPKSSPSTEFLKQKLAELMAFKDKAAFHQYGFGLGGPYFSWLTEVKAKRDAQDFRGYSPEEQVAVVYLGSLGLEYMHTEGQENEFTRNIRRRIGEVISGE